MEPDKMILCAGDNSDIEPCIYCGSTQPRTSREHVMPQALGTFEQNWTLDCVCDDCNHFFSRELELVLARDSAEAFLRVDSGLKPSTSADKFLNRRMKGTLNEPGNFDGIRVVMKSVPDGVVPMAVPQVGFRRPGEAWQYIPERELNAESLRAFDGPTVEMKVIGPRETLPRLRERLSSLGVDFTETHRVLDQQIGEGGPVTVEHEFIVDTTLRRAAAKIAFNYSAKVLGPEVMRRSDFDAVRRFVRFGEEPVPLVATNQFSILVGPEAATTWTHACGLAWVASRGELVGLVSLFNRVTYGITMCANGSDEWISVDFRHLFHAFERRIVELPKADDEVVPAGGSATPGGTGRDEASEAGTEWYRRRSESPKTRQ